MRDLSNRESRWHFINQKVDKMYEYGFHFDAMHKDDAELTNCHRF